MSAQAEGFFYIVEIWELGCTGTGEVPDMATRAQHGLVTLPSSSVGWQERSPQGRLLPSSLLVCRSQPGALRGSDIPPVGQHGTLGELYFQTGLFHGINTEPEHWF